jgi:hypothetical protein
VDPATASFEGVGHFAGSLNGPTNPIEEEVQLSGVAGMAVNYTGNGGVDAGTVYAAAYLNGGMAIAMFGPKPGGGLEFLRRWSVEPSTEAEVPYEICGPALPKHCDTVAEKQAGYVDVDIDQATGNVYAYNASIATAGKRMVVEYTPNGSTEITRFGELAPLASKTSETPEMIHGGGTRSSLAVDEDGDVYIFDINGFDNLYHRLMKFRPKEPGVFTEYGYAGAAADVAAGFSGPVPEQPVADAAGIIYVVSKQGLFIEAYDPKVSVDSPVCRFEFTKTGVTALTVNPLTGTPFFFSYKPPKRLYELGPCDPAGGEFKGGIIGETIVAPERDDLWGLAVDPVAKFTPARPAGILYGGAPGAVPNSGVGIGEEGKTSLGYIFAPAEEVPPVVESEAVERVTETTAHVTAVIDPEGSKTKFVAQYLSEAAYQQAGESFENAAEAPAGGGALANSTGTQEVAVTLAGLMADTAYRYRVVARSNCVPETVCEGTGNAKRLHTYRAEALGLHDNRVYELVSPPQKGGGQVLPAEPRIGSCGSDCKPGGSYNHFPMQSAPSGDAVVYEGTSFASGTGVAQGNEYIARRDPSLGWQTTNLTPLLMQQEGYGYQAASEGLTRALLAQVGPALSPTVPPGYRNLYDQSTSNPFLLSAVLEAMPPTRPPKGEGAFQLKYAGSTPDFSRVFFAANDVLTTEEEGVAPAPENGGASEFNLYEWEQETAQLRLVNVLPGNTVSKAGASFGVEASSEFGVPSAHPVSNDGSRVFWSSKAGKVYVREDAGLTKEVPDPGKFLSASTDGSSVLLANGHIYDLESGDITDLTGGKGGFQGVSGQSDDLTRVYFVDIEVLTGEEKNSEGAKAQAGKFNLYAWSEEGPSTKYVGTLLPEDNSGIGIVESRTWSPLPSRRTAQASPEGQFLAFLSGASLTGFDNAGVCAFGKTPVRCPEVFVYDAATGRLECASCNRTGAAPLGLSMLRLIKSPGFLPQPRYMLDSGRLYFDSQDALSQFDTNDGVEDVYEFKPEGSKGCAREGGCVALISSGRSGIDSNFLAVDPSGENVFFTSRDRMVSADTDELVDLYDAREGGGFPFESQLPQGPCQGEGCQMPPPPPAPSPPASQSPGGEGDNVPPLKCKKGQVKKNGKCVKKKQKHKPKSSKKGGKAKRGGSK